MPSFVIQLTMAVITASISSGVGWWLRGRMRAESSPINEDVVAPQEESPNVETEQRAKEAFSQLHLLTEEVASGVTAHSDSIREINAELAGDNMQATAVAEAVAKLLAANQLMEEKLATAESRLASQASQMESFVAEARTDALTGIPNRRAFDEFCTEQQEQFRKTGAPACLLIMDVDKFKLFNDTHGHQAGDAVLKGVAKTLRSTMRDRDLVARYGGEEFTTVLPATTLEEATAAADRARAAIEQATFEHEGTTLKVTASFGVAQLRSEEAVEETVKRADEALYAAKEGGRNNTHWHDGTTCNPFLNGNAPRRKVVEEPVEEAPTSDTGIDQETGLSNRRVFLDDVLRRVSEWKRGGSTLSVILIGIDNISSIVDEHGESARAMALRVATQFLKAAMRDMDHVARFDAESFALMLPGSTIEGARDVSERLRQAIGRCVLPLEGGTQLHFTVCLGAAEAHRGDDFESLVKRAESALDAAKSDGGQNRSFMHDGKGLTMIAQPQVAETTSQA